MRYAFGLVALLVVMAVVLLLSSSQTKHTLDTVGLQVALHTEDAAPRSWDADAAAALADRLAALLDVAYPPRDELAAAATTARGWVAGTAPATAEQHVAVKLRSAAEELAQAGPALDDRHRFTARRHIEEARATLAGAPPRELPAIQGIRDQIESLQSSRQQQLREVEQ